MVNFVTPFNFPVMIKVPDEVDWFNVVLLKNTQNFDTVNRELTALYTEGRGVDIGGSGVVNIGIVIGRSVPAGTRIIFLNPKAASL